MVQVMDVITDVPVHIGAVELKKLVHQKLLPKWVEFALGRGLQLEDFTLRDDKWAALLPPVGLPDIDCIAAKCFTSKKNGAPQFRSKKIVLQLELKLDLALQVLDDRRIRAEDVRIYHRRADPALIP